MILSRINGISWKMSRNERLKNQTICYNIIIGIKFYLVVCLLLYISLIFVILVRDDKSDRNTATTGAQHFFPTRNSDPSITGRIVRFRIERFLNFFFFTVDFFGTVETRL